MNGPTKKPMIVGQAPSRDAGRFRGRSGEKLARLLGVPHDRLNDVFDVVNLIDHFPGKAGKGDAFPMAEARENAGKLDVWGRPFVLLVGKGVARACGVRDPEYFEPLVFQQVIKIGRTTNAFAGRYGPSNEPAPTILTSPSYKSLEEGGTGCLEVETVLAFVVPHPSGVNRWWNDPDNAERAEVFMRQLLPTRS